MKMLYLFMDYLFLSITMFLGLMTLAAYCAFVVCDVLYEERL